MDKAPKENPRQLVTLQSQEAAVRDRGRCPAFFSPCVYSRAPTYGTGWCCPQGGPSLFSKTFLETASYTSPGLCFHSDSKSEWSRLTGTDRLWQGDKRGGEVAHSVSAYCMPDIAALTPVNNSRSHICPLYSTDKETESQWTEDLAQPLWG